MNTKAIHRLFALLIVFSLSCNFATGLINTGGDADGPKNLTAVLTAPDVVLLSWDAVEGATGYILELSMDDGESIPIIGLPSEYTSYEDLSAPEKSKLTYQVQVITESGPAGKSKVEIETDERKPNPLTVKPTYDEENAVAVTVGTQGGTVSLVDSNKVEYTLAIPQGALSVDTEIRMTAVSTLQDWPLDGNAIGAVRLQPEGLILNDVAILTMGFPVDVDPDLAIVGFAFEADGQEFHLQQTDQEKGLTDNLPSEGSHLARPVFQQPKNVVRMPLVELDTRGVSQTSHRSVSNFTRDHAPSDAAAALEQKRAAEDVADDELTPLENVTGVKDPARAQAFEIIKAIYNSEGCGELNSQISSFQVWRSTRSYVELTDDQRREYTKQIWEELSDKVKEVLEKAAEDCEKSKEAGGSAPAESPCAKALLEKIATPIDTRSNFWHELKNKMENKLSDQELQDIKDKLERCKKGYRVFGASNGVSFSGELCIDEPFDLIATFPGGTAIVNFTPSYATGGVVSESAEADGCTHTGGGGYMITFNEQGLGELQWTSVDTRSCPPVGPLSVPDVTESRTFTLPLQPAPDLSCP